MTIHGNNPKQDIKALRKRYEDLNKKKIRAETEKSTAERRLEELQSKARERYGTDDLDALRRQLAEMQTENERRRSEYQTHLDDIETRLAEVEASHQDAQSS